MDNTDNRDKKTQTFEQRREAEFMAFLDGETDSFNMYAVDPDRWAGVAARVGGAGFTIDSAGGMAPFQAEGQVMALPGDAAAPPVRMRWYYRSRHEWASLKVAVVQPECYGANPLYSAGMEEDPHQDWTDHLAVLIGQLAPVPHRYWFPTFLPHSNQKLHPVVQEFGMGVRDLIEAHHAGDARFGGTRLHEMVATLAGRGSTVAEALAEARTFVFDEYLAEHGQDEARQRTAHEVLLAHLDERPYNPWTNTDVRDDRQRPAVELAAQPFGGQ